MPWPLELFTDYLAGFFASGFALGFASATVTMLVVRGYKVNE